MGHEFTGTVVKTGSAVKTVTVGDVVVSPFTTSWYVLPFLTM
jgi:threonine dehydrogenase-like Zn-dependent dehydrogenase